jgi:HD superfamily phosphohydrolase
LKQKIINDPIYGFITVPGETVFQLIEHPYVQRLRRIRQLGMTHLVYPGANHTRFHHALGAMHLMKQAIDVLIAKGHSVSKEEEEAALIAILLHDIGHGPFSHALEDSIVSGIHHEELSELMMDKLNKDFSGKLSLAIKIFRDEYPKRFLHQLVSSQLDVDRLDFLNRDSFYTGVSEGVISSDRIIKMLEVHNDELVIEAKGIYSIEKFIVSRRLMYWQVYLHKTVVSAEVMLIFILKRAKELLRRGEELFCTPALRKFMSEDYSKKDFLEDESLLETFAQLDDSDVTASVKVWRSHPDFVLSDLCRRMMDRRLFKIRIQNKPFSEKDITEEKEKIKTALKLNDEEANYFLLNGKLVNNAYKTGSDKINILFKDGSIRDIAEAADTLNIKNLSEPVEKYYLCRASAI